MNYDLIIIGGGAAGMMAAISARRHHQDLSIAIVDRTFALGRKILVCGAGRCNVTNKNLDLDAEKRYYGASKEFVRSVIDQFGYKHIISFFSDLGVEMYLERKTSIGKLFPITNQASTITEMLIDELERNNIDIFLQTEVIHVSNQQDGFILKTKYIPQKTEIIDYSVNEINEMNAKALILSAGGMSYPSLGSNGSGYNIAEDLGHTIVEPVPAALPVESKNELSYYLQGQKLDVEATTIIDGKEIKSSIDEVMFTKYGLSGPAILNVSREISVQLNRLRKGNVKVRLNFFPEMSRKEAEEFLKERWEKRPNQVLEKSLYGLFPNKVVMAFVDVARVDPYLEVSKLSKKQIDSLLNVLTSFEAPIHATKGWNEAEFTAGGVSSDEINPKTMQSNLIKKLYFAGEIVNVDGDVGGFNLSWAWSSGFVAGKMKGFES